MTDLMPLSRYLQIGLGALLLLGLAACAGPAAGPGDWERVVESSWTLSKIDGRPPLIPDGPNGQAPTLDLSNDGRVAGFAGVNRFFGSYESTPEGELRFAALGATRMFRDDPPGLMQQEDRYLKTLGETDAFRIQNEKLALLTNGKKRLVFVPIAQPDRAPEATPE